MPAKTPSNVIVSRSWPNDCVTIASSVFGCRIGNPLSILFRANRTIPNVASGLVAHAPSRCKTENCAAATADKTRRRSLWRAAVNAHRPLHRSLPPEDRYRFLCRKESGDQSHFHSEKVFLPSNCSGSPREENLVCPAQGNRDRLGGGSRGRENSRAKRFVSAQVAAG